MGIQASLTGHLVFSTLHTNDAPSAITRLIDMGVPAYLVASSVIAIMAQRLVRVVCQKCKQPYMPPEQRWRPAGITPEMAAKATFVQGRRLRELPEEAASAAGWGSSRLMLMSPKIRELTFNGATSTEIRKAAISRRHDNALLGRHRQGRCAGSRRWRRSSAWPSGRSRT